VLQKENLIAEETFFVDDKLANVEGAKAAGIQAYQLKESDKLRELLSDLKII
jgi:FMN phosphatase YigB (HAD superfamily)